jgi:hypothetical protein
MSRQSLPIAPTLAVTPSSPGARIQLVVPADDNTGRVRFEMSDPRRSSGQLPSAQCPLLQLMPGSRFISEETKTDVARLNAQTREQTATCTSDSGH